MKKLIGYVLVFVLGFAVCAYILRSYYGAPARDGRTATFASIPRGTPPVARLDGNPVAAAAAKIEKSVVNIDTEGRPVGGFGIGIPDFFFGPRREVVPKGQASGVIIGSDGHILTNNHVVADTRKVVVTLWNGRQYDAKIVGRDPKTDLAVIKIQANGLTAATPGSSTDLRVGDWVIAVGNSLGLGTTVTVGVVSATERGPYNIEGTVLENAIQTDAAINRGNSGGALADINGNLVGINSAIFSTSPGGGSIGIGFAIPSKTAMSVADQLIESGKVVRPWIGIGYGPMDDSIRRQLKAAGEAFVPPVDGAIIAEVRPGSPADRAGLRPLDVITEINGKKVNKVNVIADEISKAKVGDIVDLTVWHARTGKTGRVAVRTGEMPSDL